MTKKEKQKMLKDIKNGIVSIPTYPDGTTHHPTMRYLMGSA